jgi:hypothetical protein
MALPPVAQKTILCLAASWRPRGFCFAGKETNGVQTAGWVRPINPSNSNAISTTDCRYGNGGSADVLDIITVRVARARPNGHQRENYEIAVGAPWLRQSIATWAQIENATDTQATSLWTLGNDSQHGVNDKVPEAVLGHITRSLLLIEPQRLDLVVANEPRYGGGTRRRIRADFYFGNVHYNFVVTDHWVSQTYNQLGTFRIPRSRICVSLPEVFKGYATKLAAAVITPDRVAAHV